MYYNDINEILRIAGVKLNESYGRMDRPFIWNDPTYSQFHRILRDNTTYGKLSAIIDNGHIYCWDSALSHHDSVVKDIEESGIKLSDDYIWVRFKEPNLCWVSAAYFNDYTDEDLEDLPQQDFEKELEDNPIIRKYFPKGVKVVRFDRINESVEDNFNSKTNCKIVLKDGKTIYGHLLSVNENYVYINSVNGNRIKKDDIKELYMYYDCEVILKDGRTIYGNFVGDFGDHKLHLDDAFNRKGWAIKDEFIDKVNYKRVLKKELTESVENKILYIIRGVPGSGKSTLAHKLTDNVVEADQYFYDDKGNYNWSADKLNQAHNWCFYTVKKYMEENRDKIAVANTFVKNKDYKRYVELAKEFGYKVDIRTCTGNYQNIHNVPDETVEKMKNSFQETPIQESVKLVNKELTDTKLVTTASELNEIIKNHPQSRIVYDKAKKWFLIGDGEVSIHTYLINDALLDGYYEPFEYKGRMITGNGHDYEDGTILYNLDPSRFVLFRTSKDPNDREDYYYDNYQYCYIYKDYCVFDRNGDFKRTPLYKFLGEPMDIDIFGDIDDEVYNGSEEEIDESVKYLNKEYSDTRIITSNYDMRDYLSNHKNLRIVYDKLNNCYFINDSEKAVHFNIMSDAIKAGFYNDYKVNSGIDLLLSNYYEQFVVFVVNDGSVPADAFNADDYTFEYKYDTFNIYDRDGQFINCPLYQILGMPNETNRIDGYNEDEDNENYYDEDDEEQLDESAENDKTLRDYAVKLANICLDALVKTKYETKISKEQVQINVDKAFKKAVPMLKNSPYEYFIILVSKNDELYASYGKTVDRKYGLITLPVFSKDPIDQTLSILYKHKSMLNKLYSTYSGDELKLKINEYAIKYLKKELEKSLSNVKSEYIDILIHECTHLLDDVRRTKTYNKSKEQNLKDDKGIETYYNSPEEQNAYYQETVSIFDEYAENKLVGYKTFDIFWDDFIRQYRGEYNMLNDKNKRKLKKRAYTYWYVYMKD